VTNGIDHIVIAVNDLEQAVADYTAGGFRVTPGGDHKGGVSRNALVTFQDGAYLELIAFAPDTLLATHWRTTLAKGEGLVDYALRADDLDGIAWTLRDAGLHPSPPQEGSRYRPDGIRVDWEALRIGSGRGPVPLPSFVRDLTLRTFRVPGGEAAVHPNGVTGVAGVTVVVADLERSSAELRVVTGHDGETPPGSLDSVHRTRRFRVGGHWIELVEPGPGRSEQRAYLERRGQLPYEVALTTGDGRTERLPVFNPHGVRFRVAEAVAAPT